MGVIWAVGFCFLLVGGGVEVEASHDESLPREQPYRTAYHFQPPNNWMNGITAHPFLGF